MKQSHQRNVTTAMVHRVEVVWMKNRREKKETTVGSLKGLRKAKAQVEGKMGEEKMTEGVWGIWVSIAMMKTLPDGLLRCAQTTMNGPLAASDHYDVTWVV